MFQQSIENLYIEKLELLSGKKLEKISLKELIDCTSGHIKTKNSFLSSVLYLNQDPSKRITIIEKFISETKATNFPEKIIKDEVCDSDFITPELHLVVKLCLNKSFLNIIDKLENQKFVSYIAEILIKIYNETKSNDILLKLNYTLKKCREEFCNNLIQYLSDDVDPEILRILYFFFKNTDKSKLNLLEKCVKNPVFAKFSKDHIEKSPKKNIDPIVFSRCTSLIDKIFLFHKSFNDSNLPNLLAFSYVVDRPFYDHLERVILNNEEFLSQKYSFNPYRTKIATLQKAISNLLNIIIVDEVKKDSGIEHMQNLMEKYSTYIITNPIFSHPIFYLVNAKMWKEIEAWIVKDPKILLAKDSNGKNLLVSTLITFAHGHVKNEEHNILLGVQKFSIKTYIDSLMDYQVSIKPSVALFTSYSEYAKLGKQNKNNVFIQTSLLYYKLLLENFIKIDNCSEKNSFLDASVFSGTTVVPIYKFIFQSEYKISHGSTVHVSDNAISLTEKQISKVFKTQTELLNEIYSHLFDKHKVNKNAELVLDNLLEEAKKCVNIDSALISKMLKDFINLKYSDEFSEKSEIQMQFYRTILEIMKLQSFDLKKFCIQEADTFRMICNMGEYEMVKELQNHQIDSPQLLNEIVSNGIISFWYANAEQSDPIAAHNFSKIAIILNQLLSKNYSVVEICKKTNIIGSVESSYLATTFSGRLNSETAQFSLDVFTKKNNPIETYNKAILTIASQFLWYPNQVNFLEPSSYIKIALLNLGHPNNYSYCIDERQKFLHQAFDSLKLNEDKEILENLNNLTSNLWDNIRNVGYGRGKMLLEHLKIPQRFNNETHFLISRFIRQSIIMNDVQSAIDWIKDERNFIQYGLEVSVSVLNSTALSMLVDEFGLQKTEKNLFGILYQHSKSKMMEHPEFKKSVNEIAVKLLTTGYQIELIEEAAKHTNYSEFIKALTIIQMKYAASVRGINYIRNSLPLNGIIQSFLTATTKLVTAKFSEDIYNQSFDFIYENLSQNHKIDISGFCHVFSSVLQPEDFINRLKKITFITGFKENFDKEKDMLEIIRNAQNVMHLILSENSISLQQRFSTRSIEIGLGNHINFESLKQYLNCFQRDQEPQKYLKQKDFLLHKFELSYKELSPITSETKIDFKSLFASASATAISGTFLYINDPDVRNTVQGIVAIFPTISGGISIANSITTNTLTVASGYFNDVSKAVVDLFKGVVKDNHEVAYTALYLAISGGVVYLSYKMYQKYAEIKNDTLTDKISMDIEAIKKYGKKFKIPEQNLSKKFSDEEIYEFLKRLEKGEFVEQNRFFPFCRRFGIITEMLSSAMEQISSDGMFTIAHALSLNTIYLNTKKVGEAFNSIKSQKKVEYKTEIVEYLHSLATAEISNIPLAITNLKIPQELCLEISGLKIVGNKPVIERYKPARHDIYLYALQHINKICLTTEQLNNINNDHFMAFIFKLSNELKDLRVENCQKIESDVVVKREYLTLI